MLSLIGLISQDMTHLMFKLKKSPIALVFLVLWYLKNKPIPSPPVYKERTVSQYGKRFKINTLVESGTFRGDMVYALKNQFKKIITIELSDYYYKNAVKLFKNNKHIEVYFGDSGKEIKKIIKSINKPALFWLDAHFVGPGTAKGKLNTPIMNELRTILNHKIKSHVILIDDAGYFSGKDDYPTIEELKDMLKGSEYSLKVENDIIRITPKTTT